MPGWLKLVGVGIVKGAQIWTGFSPIAKATLSDKYDPIVDKITSGFAQAGEVIVTVEAIGAALQLTGAQKLTAATPLISQLILKSDLMTGRKIDNPTLFNEGCIDLANAIVKILNSTKEP